MPSARVIASGPPLTIEVQSITGTTAAGFAESLAVLNFTSRSANSSVRPSIPVSEPVASEDSIVCQSRVPEVTEATYGRRP